MIDIAVPGEAFDVKRYVDRVEAIIPEIRRRGRLALLSGGTPMFLKALLYGLFQGPGRSPGLRSRLVEEAGERGSACLHERLSQVDPQAAARIHPNDLRRLVRALEVFEKTGLPISSLQREFDRPEPRYCAILAGIRRQREDLHRRIDRRVDRMLAAGLVAEVNGLWRSGALKGGAAQALGYKQIVEHLVGKLTLEQAAQRIRHATHQLARRQLTWLRGFPGIQWLDARAEDDGRELASRVLDLFRSRLA